MNAQKIISIGLLFVFGTMCTQAQNVVKDTVWTLEKCIEYALNKNIQVQKSNLNSDNNEITLKQAIQNRYPNLNASVSQSFSFAKQQNLFTGSYSAYTESTGSTYAISSSVTLFEGLKIANTIRQDRKTYEAGKYDVETTRESVSLSVLNAYLQVMYSKELVKNANKQVALTMEQLRLAEERMKLGDIAKSDYLTVKSQLASERQTLASDESELAIDRVTLMQLLEIPVNDTFEINTNEYSSLILRKSVASSDSVYLSALSMKPEVKSAALTLEANEIGIKVAKAGYLPNLSMNANISSGYNNPYTYTGFNFSSQFSDRLTPSLSFTLTIPVYNNYQVRGQVEKAKISRDQSELDLLNTRNTLRKSIEQAVVNVASAQKEYEAGEEGYNASLEAYQVASEKYAQGLINIIDFLVQKTNLMTAESKFLQSKFDLIFSYKTLDYYNGIPLYI